MCHILFISVVYLCKYSVNLWQNCSLSSVRVPLSVVTLSHLCEDDPQWQVCSVTAYPTSCLPTLWACLRPLGSNSAGVRARSHADLWVTIKRPPGRMCTRRGHLYFPLSVGFLARCQKLGLFNNPVMIYLSFKDCKTSLCVTVGSVNVMQMKTFSVRQASHLNEIHNSCISTWNWAEDGPLHLHQTSSKQSKINIDV